MAETKGIFLTRHIGKTTYKVRVHLSETANETMEDKILRLIRNDGLAMDGEYGIMKALPHPLRNGFRIWTDRRLIVRRKCTAGADAAILQRKEHLS